MAGRGYFWGFVVAMVLFSLGSLFSLMEGVEKLRHPHRVESLGWAIGILVVAIALECLSLRTAVREANRTRSGTGWWSFVRRSKTAELPVVLLEDTAALLGLGLALAGVTLAAATGVPRFHAAGSLAIGILLATIAAVLAVEMKRLLIGEAASASMSESIRRSTQSSDGVRRIIHLRTLHLGPDELLVAAKVELDHDLTFDTVVDVINTTEDCIRDRVPLARVIYLEQTELTRADQPEAVEMSLPSGSASACMGNWLLSRGSKVISQRSTQTGR